LENPQLRTEITHIQNLQYVGKSCPQMAAGANCSLGWDLRLTWAPPQPGVRGGKIGAARARVEDIDRQIGEREWALACDVRAAHAALLAIDEEIRVARDTIANRQRLTDVVSRRVQRGGTTRFDLDLVQLSLASAERAEGERQLGRTLAASALVQLLGVGPPDGQLSAAGALPDDEGKEHPGLPELEDRALASRPAVAAATARYRAAEETLRAETAARWPWFRFSAMPRVRRNEFFGAVSDLVLGVDLVLPLLNTNRGPILSAKAAREGARADVVTELAGVRSDIARALAAIDAQRAILSRLHAKVSPLLAEHDRLLALAAQAAEFDLTSVLASENLVLESRIELINARLELRRAWIALERAVGAPVAGAAASAGK
jgi:outer membrane protein TolC